MDSHPGAFNPYAPPVATRQPGDLTEVEKIRHEHLRHETGLAGVGRSYTTLGIFTALLSLLLLAVLADEFNSNVATATLLFVALTAMFWGLAYGLRTFKEGVRRPAIVFGVFGLLAFPIGTILNGYLLYLILSAKGRRVLSVEYREIIAATPHIHHKSPWLLGAIVIVVALLIPVLIVYLATS